MHAAESWVHLHNMAASDVYRVCRLCHQLVGQATSIRSISQVTVKPLLVHLLLENTMVHPVPSANRIKFEQLVDEKLTEILPLRW